MHHIIEYNLTAHSIIKLWYESLVLHIQFWISTCAGVQVYADS